MTARRMALVAAAGFALLVVALPPRPTGTVYSGSATAPPSPRERAKRAYEATNDSLGAVSAALRAREVQDSVKRLLRALPAQARNQLVADPRLPASYRAHLQSVYAASRARVTGTAVALPVFVVVDSLAGGDRTLWIEDLQGEAPSCAVVARISVTRDARGDERRLDREAYRNLGPGFPQPRRFGLCGFEAAFGPPSAAVRQWLRDRNYRPVSTGYDVSARPRASLRYALEGYIPYQTESNAALALNMRACAVGRLAQCVDAVAPTGLSWTRRSMPGLATVPADSRWYGWSSMGSPDVMNALAATMGPEKFGTLWRGNEAPPEAYRRLMGVSMDTLARRLLIGTGNPPLRVGASASFGEALSALLVAAVFAGLATLSNPRRRRG